MGIGSFHRVVYVCDTKTNIPVKWYLQFFTVQYIIYSVLFQLQQKANDFDGSCFFLCK